MKRQRAPDMAKAAPVRAMVGIALLTGGALGLGLAAYTTHGGLHGQSPDNRRPMVELVGNPYATQADLPAGAAQIESMPPYEVRCRGCGPSLRERLMAERYHAIYDEPIFVEEGFTKEYYESSSYDHEQDYYQRGDYESSPMPDQVESFEPTDRQAISSAKPAEKPLPLQVPDQQAAPRPMPAPAPGLVAIIDRHGVRLESIQAYP